MRGSIERRGNGYRIRASAGFDPRTGKRRQVTRQINGTKRDADKELTRLLRQVDIGSVTSSAAMTVNELLDEHYLPHLREGISARTHRPYAEKTRERYLWSIETYIRPQLGRLRLSALSNSVLERFRDSLLSDARLGRATAGDILAVASASFTYAGRQGLIAHDPTRFLVAPSRERVKDLVTVTPNVARVALEAAAGTPVDVGVHLALGGSFRRGEVLAVRWRDADLDASTCTIERTLIAFRARNGEAPGPIFGPPKTKSGRRRVDLPAFVVSRLRAHQADQARRRLELGGSWRGAPTHLDDLIVEMGDGSPWRPDSYSRAWKRVARGVPALENLTFHGHRHGFATLLLLQGVDVRVVSDMMGHANPATTRAIYQAVVPELRKGAGAELDKLLGSPAAATVTTV
ncbi:MAG: site-specific integrase [Actinomycetota bacterium]|nr:site-specific integrase [Actinomycetota bacterium]